MDSTANRLAKWTLRDRLGGNDRYLQLGIRLVQGPVFQANLGSIGQKMFQEFHNLLQHFSVA